MSSNRFKFFTSSDSCKFLGGLVMVGAVLGLIVGAGLLMAPDEKGEKRPSNQDIMDHLTSIAAKHNCTVETFAKYFWDTVYKCVDENGVDRVQDQWKVEDQAYKYLKRFQPHTNQDLILAGIITITAGTFVGGPLSAVLLWVMIGLLIAGFDVLKETASIVSRNTSAMLTNASQAVSSACLRLTQNPEAHQPFVDEEAVEPQTPVVLSTSSPSGASSTLTSR